MSPFLTSLRLRALVAAILVVVGLSVIYTHNGARLALESGKKEAEISVQQAGELLNLVASPYATMGGLPILQEYLEVMLAKQDENRIVYLVITSDTGERLVSAGKIPPTLPEPDENINKAVSKGIVHARNPILLRGNLVGALQFGISTQHVVDMQQAILSEGLWISTTITILVMVAVLLAGYFVVRRINHLIMASQQIVGGNYSQFRADDSGNDEISLLARNLNRMADAISSHMGEIVRSRSAVENMNASLENIVSLRTRQLEEKNIELASTIENLKTTRETLIQSEKLAGLGAIVAGVAHELNTPIGNALTVSSTLTEKTRNFADEVNSGLKRSTLQQYIDNCLMAADLIQRNLLRAAELVQSFKRVAVDQSSEHRRMFLLGESINEFLLMLHPMLKRTPYRVEVDIAKELSLNSYPGPLGQVITNLVNNSVLHGFSGRDSGTIHIHAETAVHGEWIKLVYSDDGCGIPADNLNRIYDPFFTTRLGQGGSGLGLNIVFNIINKVLGGTIDVRSAPGQGTTFVLLFPKEAPESPPT